MKTDKFTIVDTPIGDHWLYEDGQTWIVFYETVKEQNKPCFIVYKAFKNECHNKKPWTVDNKSIGKFNTLKEAMDYIILNG